MKMGPKGPEPDMAMALSGHPEKLVMPPPPKLDGVWGWVGSASNTAFAGPWGITYAINLTSDPDTGIGKWREEDFVQAMKTGKHMGVGPADHAADAVARLRPALGAAAQGDVRVPQDGPADQEPRARLRAAEMTMKLLTASASPFGRKVKVVAIEKGLMDRIELVMVATAPSTPNEQLARDNPLIKIPTLLPEGGRPIPDSLVICDYLDTLHGGERVIPASGPRRWEVLTVHTLGNGICDAAILCRYENVLRPEPLRWPDWLDGQMRKIDGSLDWLESNIAAVGNRRARRMSISARSPSAARSAISTSGSPTLNWRAARPRLAGWFGEFGARASMQRTVPTA